MSVSYQPHPTNFKLISWIIYLESLSSFLNLHLRLLTILSTKGRASLVKVDSPKVVSTFSKVLYATKLSFFGLFFLSLQCEHMRYKFSCSEPTKRLLMRINSSSDLVFLQTLQKVSLVVLKILRALACLSKSDEMGRSNPTRL